MRIENEIRQLFERIKGVKWLIKLIFMGEVIVK